MTHVSVASWVVEVAKKVCVGPFAVTGEQMRRGLGKHAFHQIHAVRGEKVEPRCLRSCVVCARGMWSDRMRSMRLFTPPAVVEEQASEQDDASEGGEPETDGIIQDVEDVRGVELGGVGGGSGILDGSKVEYIHENIFDYKRYRARWPLLPLSELMHSCVSHPYGRYADGSPWLWLLHKASVPAELTEDTRVWVCADCAGSLARKCPRVPKYALANDLWLGRVPVVFRPDKKRLSAMTFMLLSLGRAVVQKVIAERTKPQRPEEKQKGMRANTVAFPQAKMRELVTAHLPPTSEEATRYVADCLSIALVGADPEVSCLLSERSRAVIVIWSAGTVGFPKPLLNPEPPNPEAHKL